MRNFISISGREQMKKIFFGAVIQSDAQLVRECIEKNIDPNMLNNDREAALHTAARKGDIAMCK